MDMRMGACVSAYVVWVCVRVKLLIFRLSAVFLCFGKNWISVNNIQSIA